MKPKTMYNEASDRAPHLRSMFLFFLSKKIGAPRLIICPEGIFVLEHYMAKGLGSYYAPGVGG